MGCQDSLRAVSASGQLAEPPTQSLSSTSRWRRQHHHNVNCTSIVMRKKPRFHSLKKLVSPLSFMHSAPASTDKRVRKSGKTGLDGHSTASHSSSIQTLRREHTSSRNGRRSQIRVRTTANRSGRRSGSGCSRELCPL